MKNPFPIVIVGSGPAGSMAAIVLARRGWDVLVLDRGAPASKSKMRVGESLPGAAQRVLNSQGLSHLLAAHPRNLGNSVAWGSPELQVNDFLRDPDGYGWHLDRARFDAALIREAQAAGAKFRSVQVLGATRDAEGLCLETDRGPLRAAFAIDASGRASVLAKKLGATRSRDDSLIAHYAWTPVDKSESVGSTEALTLIESTRDGWWYTSVVPGGKRVIAFHTDAALIAEKKQRLSDWKVDLLATTHVKERLGQSALEKIEVFTTEAGGARLDVFGGSDWCAIGDAALSFDPVSSQGILNALLTGVMAAQELAEKLGSPAAEENRLVRYVATLEQIRAHYLRRHVLYYSMEQRWLKSKFWKSRLPALKRAS